MSLRVERLQTLDGALRLVFRGAIDDRADLDNAFNDLPARIIIDLGEVERMNSIGIKRWVVILSAVTKKHEAIVESLPYPVALQASCTSDLFGRAVVQSCTAPYHCPKCHQGRTVLVTREEVGAAGNGAPAKNCPKCGGEMSFDDLDEYFSFFNAVPA